jgi:16S rRNA G1207 methylase RsmC
MNIEASIQDVSLSLETAPTLFSPTRVDAGAKHLIEESFNRLLVGGALWMVTKRHTWYRNKLTSVFGGVRVTARNTYLVFEARKKSLAYASRTPTSSRRSGRAT